MNAPSDLLALSQELADVLLVFVNSAALDTPAKRAAHTAGVNALTAWNARPSLSAQAVGEPVAAYERMDAAYLAQWEATQDAEEKLTTLLTGLEALAGRMDKRDQWMRTKSAPNIGLADAFKNAADDIRTLASAGLEGKTDGR